MPIGALSSDSFQARLVADRLHEKAARKLNCPTKGASSEDIGTAQMIDSLCETCIRKRDIISGNGSRFLLCLLSPSDDQFVKYPPQPVLDCSGYQSRPKDPGANGDGAIPR